MQAQTNKDNYYNKPVKIRQVYAQHNNTKIISQFKSYSHYMQPIVQTFANATRLGVSADILCSSLTNMGYKQHTDLEYHSLFKAMQTKNM